MSSESPLRTALQSRTSCVVGSKWRGFSTVLEAAAVSSAMALSLLAPRFGPRGVRNCCCRCCGSVSTNSRTAAVKSSTEGGARHPAKYSTRDSGILYLSCTVTAPPSNRTRCLRFAASSHGRCCNVMFGHVWESHVTLTRPWTVPHTCVGFR